MRFPWANTFLLLLIILQAVTGYFGFTAGRPPERWLLWLHGIGAYAMVLLIFWKGAIILNVFGRAQRWTPRRLVFIFMAALLVVTLLSGLLWTFFGPRYLLGFSLISVHIFLAVLLFGLAAWHTVVYRWIVKVPKARDRRAFLSAAALGAAGMTIWAVSSQVKRLLSLPGARRRFTGSYETGSFSPNFPSVSWINDNPAPVAIADWRLTISGAVQQPLTLDYDQLLSLTRTGRHAILDCTGGWYSGQNWLGVPLTVLLSLAHPSSKSRSITFQSVTGYSRRFAIEQSDSILLATHVAGDILSHGHGFPLRLVVPGERGLSWVKWLAHIRLNETSHLVQPPLPLQ